MAGHFVLLITSNADYEDDENKIKYYYGCYESTPWEISSQTNRINLDLSNVQCEPKTFRKLFATFLNDYFGDEYIPHDRANLIAREFAKRLGSSSKLSDEDSKKYADEIHKNISEQRTVVKNQGNTVGLTPVIQSNIIKITIFNHTSKLDKLKHKISDTCHHLKSHLSMHKH